MAGAQDRGRASKIDPRPHQEESVEDGNGIRCAVCGCRHFEVIETRPVFGNRIRRRRECRHCGRRITTMEREL